MKLFQIFKIQVLEIDENSPLFDGNIVDRFGFCRRRPGRFAGLQIELGAVAGTDNLLTLEPPIREKAALVGADIAECIEFTINPGQQYFFAIYLEPSDRSFLDIIGVAHRFHILVWRWRGLNALFREMMYGIQV